MTLSTPTSDFMIPAPSLQGTVRVVRVDLNALEKEGTAVRVKIEKKRGSTESYAPGGNFWWRKASNCELVDFVKTKQSTQWAKWKNLSIDVIPEVGPSTALMRMAFADSKLYYMMAQTASTYQLKSTGVTMSVR
jgi:hypothetical protein